MKNGKEKTMNPLMPIFLGAVIWVLSAGTVLGESRSPFLQPPARVNPYNYEKAIRKVTLKGILRTERTSRAIVKADGQDVMAVYGLGDKLRLIRNGLLHEFVLSRIEEKIVWFMGRNNQSYEVVIK